MRIRRGYPNSRALFDVQNIGSQGAALHFTCIENAVRLMTLAVTGYRVVMVLLLAGVGIGLIVFQSALIAPLIRKTLDPPLTGKVLRSLWPKFFLILTGVGTVFTLVHFVSDPDNLFLGVIFGLLVVGFPLIAYLIIPATEKARDSGNDRFFGLLHRLSVILTVLVLLAYIVAAALALS